ncbi:hypothetical protein QX249_12265 [Vibrio parahaemolyticus]|uniref:Uncharacterized protein n=1 Tax=Vibrio parahaemolyticus TaxID=670 RepID=A0AAW8PZN5_VIBPH|nr:hypothetical protein [Vibrio parahaemolyticus]MDS1821437.1 hypothetical protein [Vibrio parahaemolyticus]
MNIQPILYNHPTLLRILSDAIESELNLTKTNKENANPSYLATSPSGEKVKLITTSTISKTCGTAGIEIFGENETYPFFSVEVTHSFKKMAILMNTRSFSSPVNTKLCSVGFQKTILACLEMFEVVREILDGSKDELLTKMVELSDTMTTNDSFY